MVNISGEKLVSQKEYVCITDLMIKKEVVTTAITLPAQATLSKTDYPTTHY
jgi:hypothetical protein